MTDTVPDLTPYLAGAASATLEDWGAVKEATGPAMTQTGVEIWSDGEGASAGVWESTAGPSFWELAKHEVIHVVAGSMTVTPEGGEAKRIASGDTAVFPRGWRGTWDIHETLRKVYIIF